MRWPGPLRPGLALPAAILLLACGGAIRVLVSESTIRDAQARLDAQAADAAAGLPAVADPPALAPRVPPRALLADALLAARLAQARPAGADRRGLLERALADAAAARRARPYWGETWAATAFALSLRDGDAAASTRQALARSYADAPYLHGAAGWRSALGFQQWAALDPATRAHVVNEAVWLARSGQTAFDGVAALARESPGYRAFMAGWIANRRADADFAHP